MPAGKRAHGRRDNRTRLRFIAGRSPNFGKSYEIDPVRVLETHIGGSACRLGAAAQRLADQDVDGARVHVGPRLVHRGTRDRRFPAEADECVTGLRARDRSIELRGSMRVGPRLLAAPGLDSTRLGARECQGSAVDRQMTGRARETKILRIVGTAIGPVDDMVDLEPDRGATAGRLATSAIATPHEPDYVWWDVLVRPLGTLAVERTDVLGVAASALERGVVDRNGRAGALLSSPIAAGHTTTAIWNFARPVGPVELPEELPGTLEARSSTASHSAVTT